MRVDLTVSDDKKAIEATFDSLVIDFAPTPAPPVVTRVVSFAFTPLPGFVPGTEIPFRVMGSVVCEKGANAHLIISVNDQTTVVDFPGEIPPTKDFTQEFKFRLGVRPRFTLLSFCWPIEIHNRAREHI